MPEVHEQLTTALADRYAIERQIGAGGMAVVYLARDLKHDRKVALKVLNPDLGVVLGADRFLSEIRVTANLQHPNLLPLFDSGEADGLLYYVMPYVEGETLRGTLAREKQLPVDDALHITIAVASALDYAHRHGVIHRDLKPENILLHEGQPMVADFGIALAVSNAGGNRITQTGLSLGTPQYMSPEQATGDRVIDGRTDIYSLGAVLYEMLTGEPPHTGNTSQAIIARVLTEKPRSIRTTRPTVSGHLERAVERALEKLPANRWATGREFSEALTSSRTVAPQAMVGEPAAALSTRGEGAGHWIRRNRLVATLSVVTALSIAAAVWPWLRPAPIPQVPVMRFTITLPAEAQPRDLAISPDGARLAYTGQGTSAAAHLYLRAMDRLDVTQMASTEEGTGPSFSPDGLWIAFFTHTYSTRGGLTLFKVPIAGGTPVDLCESPKPINGVAWGDRDVIVFSTNGGGVYAVGASGGKPRAVIRPGPDQQFAVRPGALLPGGRTVLVTRVERGLSQIVAVDVESGRVQPLVTGASRASYVNRGYIVYQQNDAMMAAPFDAGRVRLSGSPIQLASAVGEFSVSATGSIVYLGTGSAKHNLALVDRQGRAEVLPAGTRAFRGPVVAPDGRRIVFFDGGVWSFDLARGTLGRLSFGTGSQYAAWSPDGSRVLFNAPSAERGQDIFSVPADASAPAALLLSLPGEQWEAILAPDGRRLIYRENNASTARDIFVVPLDSPQVARPLAATRYQERAIALSPDGRWLAYVSDESGVNEVYVRQLDGPAARHQVSSGGGTEPRWARSGRELFFRTDGDSLFSVSVEPGSVFRPGSRRLVFVLRAIRDPFHANYDVFPDGRFVFVREAAGEGQLTASFTVVLNEFDRLAREQRQR